MRIFPYFQSVSGLVPYCLVSRLHWMRYNATSDGGRVITPKWYKYRYGAPNGSATLAQIAIDFQNKN